MTGLSISASVASLLSLRVFKNWTSLDKKLPKPCYRLQQQRVDSKQQHIRLDIQESNVFHLATGQLSITQIAEELSLTVQLIQRISFRLIIAGFVREITGDINIPAEKIQQITPTNKSPKNSSGFLNNLMGFLKNRR